MGRHSHIFLCLVSGSSSTDDDMHINKSDCNATTTKKRKERIKQTSKSGLLLL